jgi:hypothetical protein
MNEYRNNPVNGRGFSAISLLDPVAGKKNSLLRVRKTLQLVDKTRLFSVAADFLPCDTGIAGKSESSRWLWRAVLAIAIMLPLAVRGAAHAEEAPSFVGRQACAGCHAAEFDPWKGCDRGGCRRPCRPWSAYDS